MSNEIALTGRYQIDDGAGAVVLTSCNQPGVSGENVDMIWFGGKLYTKVDHDALEKIVNDLVAVEQITGPVVTGPSCKMLAERIKRAVGAWR